MPSGPDDDCRAVIRVRTEFGRNLRHAVVDLHGFDVERAHREEIAIAVVTLDSIDVDADLVAAREAYQRSRSAIGSFGWPAWRNGRRDRLKLGCPRGRVGSTPTGDTNVRVAELAYAAGSNPVF